MAHRNRWFTYEKWWFSMAMLNNQMVIVNVDPLVNVGWLRLYISLTIVIPPLNPGIFGGGVGQEISQKYFTWPHEIYPPTCFWASKRSGGGAPDTTILAQRWYGTPFHFQRTYMHIYIHACIQPGPGETIINQIFLAEIFLGVGGGTPPLFEIFKFLPHPPLAP